MTANLCFPYLFSEEQEQKDYLCQCGFLAKQVIMNNITPTLKEMHREDVLSVMSFVYHRLCSNVNEWHTSVAADFAIWRCASSFAFPGGDVTLEFAFISMPTSLAVTVSTVTLPMAFTQKEFYTVRKKATFQSTINFLSLQKSFFLPL